MEKKTQHGMPVTTDEESGDVEAPGFPLPPKTAATTAYRAQGPARDVVHLVESTPLVVVRPEPPAEPTLIAVKKSARKEPLAAPPLFAESLSAPNAIRSFLVRRPRLAGLIATLLFGALAMESAARDGSYPRRGGSSAVLAELFATAMGAGLWLLLWGIPASEDRERVPLWWKYGLVAWALFVAVAFSLVVQALRVDAG